MLIRIGYDIELTLPIATPIVVMLYLHPDANGVPARPEAILTEPEVPIRDFYDGFGNRCGRLTAPGGVFHLREDMLVDVPEGPEMADPSAPQIPIEELPSETLQFLLGSRYCQTQEMLPIAWELFADAPEGWKRVQAVCDWVHDNIKFDYKAARPNKTALDIWTERTGVCRDFMHLAITFCRCLNIPARYATGYLGDFGVPVNPAPMDFAAYFEAYLGGKWYPFDARNNEQRIGRLLMARGRDAVDVALTTSYGPVEVTKFEVITEYA